MRGRSRLLNLILLPLLLVTAGALPAGAKPPKVPVGTFTANVEKEATTGWGIVVLRYVDGFESWRNKQARIAPEAGGNLFSFTFGGQELLLQPAALADLAQQRSGMPVMFPTPNRVRDAQMSFEGRQFRFEANNQNNFIHGLARRRPWKLAGPPTASNDRASVTLALDWDPGQPDFKRFPIKHRLTVTYTVLVDGLEIRYEVHNQDGQRLPYGFGLHPYFRVPGARRDVRLTVPLGQRMEAQQMLPTGKLLPVGPDRDLRPGRTLDQLDLDDVYFGMAPGKRAGVQLGGSNIDLSLEASKEFTHLVVFTPWDRPVFAVENQTSSTDAHNLWTKGFKREANLLVLEPGAKGGGFVRWRLARIQPTAVVPGERPEDPHARYDQAGSPHLAPLLTEVIRYPTVAGNDKARKDQQAWLKRTGEGLKFTVRDAGLVTEIELPASVGSSPGKTPAPVLGLVVHGDVQPVEEAKWTIPPWKGVVQDGHILGRGAADDKGPLVQALLAMKALRESEVPRTHTVRLLVGSDEESGSKDIASYLKHHRPPDYSLVLDSEFPVVVGEKAWDALFLEAPLGERPGRTQLYEVVELSAGLSPSIVPDEARLVLRWKSGTPQWQTVTNVLGRRPPQQDIAVSIEPASDRLRVTTRGRAAHGGVNLAGGRNALVALARLVEGVLPSGGADDLLAAARLAGKDLMGTGFGLTERHPLWGRYSVNVAMLKPEGSGHRLTINLRRPPPRTAAALEAHLNKWTERFNARTGSTLKPGGYFKDEPLVFDPKAKLVRRLQDIYARAAGRRAPPAISGGGTYAKRLPNSIAFGTWFPGKPYPGHDVDEKVALLDLQRGAHVVVEALMDLATGPPLIEPFKP